MTKSNSIRTPGWGAIRIICILGGCGLGAAPYIVHLSHTGQQAWWYASAVGLGIGVGSLSDPLVAAVTQGFRSIMVDLATYAAPLPLSRSRSRTLLRRWIAPVRALDRHLYRLVWGVHGRVWMVLLGPALYLADPGWSGALGAIYLGTAMTRRFYRLMTRTGEFDPRLRPPLKPPPETASAVEEDTPEPPLPVAPIDPAALARAALGVGPDATSVEIRRAYRRLVKGCHPDLHRHDPLAAERFRILTAARDRLDNIKVL